MHKLREHLSPNGNDPCIAQTGAGRLYYYFTDAAIGHQEKSLDMANGAFVRELCDSRTFCRKADIDMMRAAGKIVGGGFPIGVVAFGEVGLAGEIRPVPNGQERIHEAAKHGFRRVIAPRENAPKRPPQGIEILPVARLAEALELV